MKGVPLCDGAWFSAASDPGEISFLEFAPPHPQSHQLPFWGRGSGRQVANSKREAGPFSKSSAWTKLTDVSLLQWPGSPLPGPRGGPILSPL